MNKRERRNKAKFHACYSAAQHLRDIVGARIAYEADSEDEELTNKEYLHLADRLEKMAFEYREKFTA
jgi:hypothetical protein